MPGLQTEFWTSDLIQISIFAFVIMIGIGFFADRYWRIRQIEIDGANALTEQHIEALEKLLSFDGVSQRVRLLLVDIETLMAKRSLASSLIDKLFNPRESEPSKDTASLIDEIARISKLNPAFELTLKTFLETGIFAMTLRWPETRGEYVKVTVIVEKEKPAAITRAVASVSSNSYPVPKLAYAS